MELQKVIKELLTSNNFISLPTFGSFVQHYEPAKLSPDGTSFLPPRQVVTFDLNRNFNDEVLELYVQNKLGASTSEAAEKVKAFVDSVKKSLELGEEVEFESVGFLKKNEIGQIVLIQMDDLERVSSTFGLLEIEAVEKEAVTSQSKPIQKPIAPVVPSKSPKASKVKTSTLVLSLLAALVLLAILVVGATYLMPDFWLWQKADTVAVTETDPACKDELSEDSLFVSDSTSSMSDNTTSENLGVKQTVDVVADKKSALFYQEPIAQERRTYYIIAGSFAKIENAEILAKKLASMGHNPEIVNSDGRFRVAISKFTDRNRALRELERLRREKPNEQVWLLGL